MYYIYYILYVLYIFCIYMFNKPGAVIGCPPTIKKGKQPGSCPWLL